jgi:phosphoribosylpyrophosphate synthetase
MKLEILDGKIVKEGRFTYSGDFYCNDIRQWAEAVIERLPERTDTLVCSSSSGIALAAAVAALINKHIKIIYISKKGEDRHNSDRTWIKSKYRVFVDDIIDYGGTMERCWRAAPFHYAITCYQGHVTGAAREIFNKYKITHHCLHHNEHGGEHITEPKRPEVALLQSLM